MKIFGAWFVSLLIITVVLFAGCKKTPPDPHFIVPADVKDFFVNYDAGTCWVYEDTMQKNRFDTIELTVNRASKFRLDDEIEREGSELDFAPKKTNSFRMYVLQGAKNCSIEINPNPPNANGTIAFAKEATEWSKGVVLKDSMTIGSKTFKNVLIAPDGVGSFSNLVFAKNVGLVSFWSQGLPGIRGGIYTLVRTFKK